MQLNISGHQLDITDALRDYVTEKMSRLERHFDRHRTPALVGPHAALSGHGLSAGAGL